MRRAFLSCLAVIVLVLVIAGAPASAQSLLLSGATVHTVSGETLSSGKVLIKDGKIAAVGTDLAAGDAQTIDLTGQHLFPGLIALNTVVGLVEISGVRATQDTTEVGDYTPDVESWIAVNPDSELIPVARANGIAYFQPVPHGGTVSGQSGLVAVEGWTTEQRTIKKPLALHVFWPNMDLNLTVRSGGGRGKGKGGPKSPEEQAKERRTKLRALQEFFDDAAAYSKAKDAAAKGASPALERIPAWDAMIPYVHGEALIMIHADEARQITAAVQWATTNKFKFVIAGGRDAWMVPDLLSTNHVPIIYGDTFTLPGRDTDSYDVHFSAPGKLAKAGIKVVFSAAETSFDAPLAKNLPYCAAQAVAFGLPYDEAVKGITLYPAQIAGVSDRLGSIEPGKEATLFSASGDILDLRADVTHFWFAGKEISLENRHTRLYRKYQNRPKP